MLVVDIVHAEHAGAFPTLPVAAELVPAGFPSPAQDYFDGDLDLTGMIAASPASTYYLVVSGDSMIGAGIADRSLLAVDRAVRPEDGHIVIAVLDGELTVKRLRLGRDGVQLCAENPKYPPIQVQELSQLEIWGVVTWVFRRVGRD